LARIAREDLSMTSRRAFLVALALLSVGGCAGMPSKEPLQVAVADVESLPGEGMEIRMLVRLRIQNPNPSPISYSGTYVEFDVLDRTFASGVSSEAGTVPAFGETVIGVPVTVSVLRMVRQVVGMLDGAPVDRIRYSMTGKLHVSAFHAERFRADGEFKLPATETGSTD
jgi:LEA14-like dessication related protein